MGVAGQVVEHMFGAAERRLGVDDPVVAEQYAQPYAEGAWLRKRKQAAMKLEFTAMEGAAKSSDELAAENPAQCVDREEESARGIDPLRPVEGQAAGGNDVMDMRMMLEVLSPGVEHTEESDIGSEVLGIPPSISNNM